MFSSVMKTNRQASGRCPQFPALFKTSTSMHAYDPLPSCLSSRSFDICPLGPASFLTRCACAHCGIHLVTSIIVRGILQLERVLADLRYLQLAERSRRNRLAPCECPHALTVSRTERQGGEDWAVAGPMISGRAGERTSTRSMLKPHLAKQHCFAITLKITQYERVKRWTLSKREIG